MKDAVIVGGGPAGCFLGKALSEKGYEVTILEEHSEIGQPMCCAGILGAKGLKGVGMDPKNWSLNELRRGVFHSPSGDSITLSRNQVEAYAIDRSRFDRDLAEGAARAGSDIELNAKCVDVAPADDEVSLEIEKRGKREQIKSRVVVGADGPSSIVARKFGLVEEFAPTVGAQAEIFKEKESDAAHVYFENELSRNYFAWIVPAGNVYRVGLIDKKKNVRKRLLRFIDDNPSLPQNSRRKMLTLTAGLIPKPGFRKIYGDRVVLVGDAAAHIKPLTGGGLYMGLSGSKIASEVLDSALSREPTEENLKKYGERVEEKFGREFELGNRFQEIFRDMSDEDISDLLELLEDPKFRNVVLENGEFDYHSRLVKSIIEEGPSIVQSLGPRKLARYLKMLADSWRKWLGLF